MKGRIVILGRGVEKKEITNSGCCKAGMSQAKL